MAYMEAIGQFSTQDMSLLCASHHSSSSVLLQVTAALGSGLHPGERALQGVPPASGPSVTLASPLPLPLPSPAGIWKLEAAWW